MKSQLEDILKKVAEGTLSPEGALEDLKHYPYQDLTFAKVDHHRELRRGFPEIVFGLGKTEEQIREISKTIIQKGSNLLVTKVKPEIFTNIQKEIPQVLYNELGQTMSLKVKTPPPGNGKIAIITAGTSDIPVAEEAAVTCDILGNEIDRIYDVGVAGIHRLFGSIRSHQGCPCYYHSCRDGGRTSKCYRGLDRYSSHSSSHECWLRCQFPRNDSSPGHAQFMRWRNWGG